MIMSNDIKICVIISNYNHFQYLNDSIKSITEQTYGNMDIVVVDDGSTNKSNVEEIISLYQSDRRVRYISYPKNMGKWYALNTAIASTDAQVVTSHDADDISLSWRIEAQLETLLRTKTAHNLCGFISCWNDDDIKKNKNIQKPLQMSVYSGEDIVKNVIKGFDTPGINHYFTGNFETAGVSAMFYKRFWNLGCRFLPSGQNLRTLMSEDSDFNFRMTTFFRSTSILLEKPYLYRRNTSTNKEER